MQQYLEAGKVVTTHGVRGEMKLELWCDGVDFLKKAGRLYASAKGGKCYNITSIRPQGQMALLQLEGVNDMNFRPYEYRVLALQILVKQCIHKFVNLRFV